MAINDELSHRFERKREQLDRDLLLRAWNGVRGKQEEEEKAEESKIKMEPVPNSSLAYLDP